MICKLIVLAACVAVALSQADKYPAGVSPAACPNYPYCDNAAVHLYRNIPVVPATREYPAGVHPATCPNYPYCSTYGVPIVAPTFYHAAPLAKEWPAGVSPAACPNYPYCN